MTVPIQTKTVFVPGTPQRLFEGDFVNSLWQDYDVASDGRFIMKRGARAATARLSHSFRTLRRERGFSPRMKQPFDYAVQLECPFDLLVDRIAGRAKAEGRADDSPEAVRKRLQVYEASTAPVIDYYRQHGQLTVVDGVGTLDEVFTRILEAIAPVKEVG